jgi:hypothetical protein
MGRNDILNAMKVQYPALDVNQLYVDDININGENKSATVRTVSNSNVYGSYEATAFAGNYSAIEFGYQNPTLTQTTTSSGTTTFKVHGVSKTATYAISATDARLNFSTSTGVLS